MVSKELENEAKAAFQEPQGEPKAEPKTEPAKPAEAPALKSNPRVESGAVVPETLSELWTMANFLAKSGFVPEQYVNNPAGIMAAFQIASERGLNKFSALQKLSNVNGTTAGHSELPLAEVFRSGVVEDFEEYWLDFNGKRIEDLDFKTPAFAAVCEFKPNGRRKVVRVFSLLDAVRAKLIKGLTTGDKPNLPTDGKDNWIQYFKRMLQMRARGWALKDGAPDVIAGLPMPEYDEHVISDSGASSSVTAPSGAKARLLNGGQQEATAAGQGATVSGVREEALGSVPRSDLQGDAERSPGQPDSAVQGSPHGAAPELVRVPGKAPKGAKGTRAKGLADHQPPLLAT